MLNGKKLLILGCTVSEFQIIDAAREMGVYTIVTDNHVDWTQAPAKYQADEAWDISWSDVSALKERAIASGVDGVMAGYSERRIEYAIKLSRELNKPFYVQDERILYKTFNKQLFKNICREYSVPVTRDYYVDSAGIEVSGQTIEYPVVVKPLDNGGSRGIRTCWNVRELEQGIKYALSFSQMENVIVEELIRNAQEVVVYYTISDGEVALSAMCDKFERKTSEGFNSLPDVYMYPSLHTREFIEKHNADVISTLKSMEMREGSANLQGFYVPGRGFVFFEMDFRPGGTNTYHFTDYFSGENYLKMLIKYSLTGDPGKENIERADPLFAGKYGCIFTLLSKDGVISQMGGEEAIKNKPNVLYTCFYHSIGTKIEVNGSQFPKTFRAYIVGDNMDEIKKTILEIQQTVYVKDEFGENMLFTPFDVDKLDVYQK